MSGPRAESTIRIPLVILGGGVTGLWTLYRALAAGHQAVLIDTAPLGGGQTNASQGILHAGVKYRLPGNTADSSRAVADVQPIWHNALSGGTHEETATPIPNLSSARTLSPVTHFWTLPGSGGITGLAAQTAARAVAAGAAAAMRSGTRALGKDDRPPPFDTAPTGVAVYEAGERVLDPPSLVAALRDACDQFAQSGSPACFTTTPDSTVTVSTPTEQQHGCIIALRSPAGHTLLIAADHAILTAGEGNEALITQLAGRDAAEAASQRRPLRMLIAEKAPAVIHGHCLDASPVPRLTITTSTSVDCRHSWYIGGGPAERGVALSEADAIDAAKAELARCLPWLDLSQLEWRSFLIDRVEGRDPNGKRPDGPALRQITPGVRALWPTKLVLAPVAAEMALDAIGAPQSTQHTGTAESPIAERASGFLTPAPIAPPRW